MSKIRAAITIETVEDLDEATARSLIEHLGQENERYPYRVYATLSSVSGAVTALEFASVEASQPEPVVAE